MQLLNSHSLVQGKPWSHLSGWIWAVERSWLSLRDVFREWRLGRISGCPSVLTHLGYNWGKGPAQLKCTARADSHMSVSSLLIGGNGQNGDLGKTGLDCSLSFACVEPACVEPASANFPLYTAGFSGEQGLMRLQEFLRQRQVQGDKGARSRFIWP